MRINTRRIFEYTFIASILGYPFVAGFSETFGLPNRQLSLGLRSLVAFSALFFLLEGIKRTKSAWHTISLQLLTIFFLTYLARLTYSTLISGSDLRETPSHYWLWTIGSSILPALGLAAARIREINWTETRVRFFKFALLTALLVSPNLTTQVTNINETYDSGRAMLETLNPISLGHLGASLMIAGLALLIIAQVPSRPMRWMAFAGSILGAGVVVAANSRGPILAVACALLFGWTVMHGKKKYYISIAIITIALSFVPALEWAQAQFGVTTYSRLFEQSFKEEVNVVARYELYISSLTAFLENPFFGAGIEIGESGAYPHNVSIEAFFSTGILGGMALLMLQASILVTMFRICRREPDFIWVGMLVVQYVVGAQLSGAIYSSTQFWAVIGLSIYASRAFRFRASVPRRLQRAREGVQNARGDGH